eukprot:356244-Chlamydomonas_euryale.AAC.13
MAVGQVRPHFGVTTGRVTTGQARVCPGRLLVAEGRPKPQIFCVSVAQSDWQSDFGICVVHMCVWALGTTPGLSMRQLGSVGEEAGSQHALSPGGCDSNLGTAPSTGGSTRDAFAYATNVHAPRKACCACMHAQMHACIHHNVPPAMHACTCMNGSRLWHRGSNCTMYACMHAGMLPAVWGQALTVCICSDTHLQLIRMPPQLFYFHPQPADLLLKISSTAAATAAARAVTLCGKPCVHPALHVAAATATAFAAAADRPSPLPSLMSLTPLASLQAASLAASACAASA